MKDRSHPSGRRERARLQTLYTVAAATLAAIVPFVLLAGFWIRSELNRGRQDTEAFLSANVRAITYRADGEVREQLSALQALAALPSLDRFDEAAFRRDAERTIGTRPNWQVLGVVDLTTGEHLLSLGKPWPGENEQPILQRLRDAKTSEVMTRVAAPGQEDVLLYVPVLRPEGVTLGLVAQVDVSALKDAASGQSSTILVTVIDEQGNVLWRSRDPARFIGRPVAAHLRDQARGSDGILPTTTLDGEEVLAAYSRSALTGWTSWVATNRAQLDATSRSSVVATVGAVLLGILLIAILGVFVFHTIMQRRVSNERLAASRALGELDARLLVTTQQALDEQRKASTEREALLREIYHRVKNNLQIVQSLLRLGSRELRAEQREPFEAAVRRIGAMARVHTLLYNSPDLASIDFKDYLVELLRELSEGFSAEERAIDHVLDANSLRLPLDTAVPLAFIAVEIITNAFRHAFPSGGPGQIHVSVEHENGTGRLIIDDTGVGLSAEQRQKRRLGLTIVGKLVHQIGGSLEEPQPGSSRFIITFPTSGSDESEKRLAAAMG